MSLASDIRAGAAYIEIALRDSKFVKGLHRASKKLQAFGASVRQMGLRVAVAGSAMMGSLFGATKVFASAGDELDKMQSRTGFSVESLSILSFAAEQSGTSLDALDSGLGALARFSLAIERGLGESAYVLDQLGISVEQFKRSTPEERFKLLADGISQIADPTRRAGFALSVFGRTGRELLPLLEGGRAALAAYEAEADELGIVMTQEDVAAAVALNDAMGRLKRQLYAIAIQIGAALAPMLTDLQQQVKPILKSVIQWIKANKALIVSILKVSAIVTVVGIGLIVLGTLLIGFGATLGALAIILKTVGAAVGIFGTIIAGLVSPIGLAITAITALGAYLVMHTGLGEKALTRLSTEFDNLKQDATDAWQGIADALMAGDIELAARILWLSLKMEWQRGIHLLNGLWVDAKETFVSIWTDAQYDAAESINNGLASIEAGFTETMTFLADAWSVFTHMLTSAWHKTVADVKKAWVRLKSLVMSGIDVTAETNRIEREMQEAIEAADKELLEVVGQRDRERSERQKQIEQERAAAEKTLGQMRREEQARIQKQYAAELASTGEELARLRKEWQDAIAEAARKRQQSATGEPGPDLEALFNRLDYMLRYGARKAVEQQQRKVETKGTFYALAARQLGADTPAERTAKATEQIVVNTRDLLAEAKRGGLVFSP